MSIMGYNVDFNETETMKMKTVLIKEILCGKVQKYILSGKVQNCVYNVFHFSI